MEPGGRAVDAHGEIVISEARLEDSGVVVRRHVPVAAHHVVDVLTIAGGVRSSLEEERVVKIGKRVKIFECDMGLTQARKQNSESETKFVHS